MNPIYLVILSVIGFAVSFYIYHSKKHDKPLYCPIGGNCDEVVKSKYGKTFGIENTVPGMLYYLLIFLYGLALLINRNIFKYGLVYHSLVGASLASVLASIYLTGVQAFVLKKWCYYCITSTISSILILLVLLT